MHIHNVYFWLKDDEDDRSRIEFEEGLSWLANDPAVESGYFGTPAATDRDVVNNSYSYGMVLVFEDKDGHDSYQEGVVHQRFMDKNKKKWSKIAVYDIDS